MSTQLDQEIEISNILGKPYKVILFNDDTNTMEAVARQIIKATHCSGEQAINIMIEAHSTGEAVVFTGSKERCELVAEILGEIGLTTDIIPA